MKREAEAVSDKDLLSRSPQAVSCWFHRVDVGADRPPGAHGPLVQLGCHSGSAGKLRHAREHLFATHMSLERSAQVYTFGAQKPEQLPLGSPCGVNTPAVVHQ
jgi:hypothetical protein